MDLLRNRLPAPPEGKTGWPWTEGTPLSATGVDPLSCPRVTVVTPSFNQGIFLEETIRSVLLQGYPKLEYIVIDGGSSDSSVDIIRRYEPYLAFWTSEGDRGAADAIRKGFERATGDIFAYLNSDDPYLPGALFAVARAMDTKTDFVYGNTFWIDAEGRRLGDRRQTPIDKLGYLYGGFDLQQPSTFWRRDLYAAAGGMNPDFSFAFDTDLFFRFVKAGARFKHVRQYFSCYRIHPESKSFKDSSILEQELSKIRQQYLSFPAKSLRARWFRNRSRARRALSYILQGDFGWLISRIPDRWLSRHSRTTVGPKARWL